jgi:hypothetical protein
MSLVSTSQVHSRNSRVAFLLQNQDKVYAVEKSSDIFDTIIAAAKVGTNRLFLDAALKTMDDAVAKGATLSPRSAELYSLVVESLRVPALFRSFH